jgi:small GTP-binding protein
MRKICLLGDGAVGKTSLIRRYVHDIFNDEYIMTIGTKVSKKNMDLDGKELTLMIWDILGQKEHTNLHSAYYKGAAGAIVVCDFTNKNSMEHLTKWIDDFRAVAGNVPVVIAVNKQDIENKAYLFDDAKKIADK